MSQMSKYTDVKIKYKSIITMMENNKLFIKSTYQNIQTEQKCFTFNVLLAMLTVRNEKFQFVSLTKTVVKITSR